MDCGTARKVLFRSQVLHGDKLAPAQTETRDAGLHLEQCVACQEFFAAEKELSEALRKSAPREGASSTLRERVLSRIAEEQEKAKRPIRWSFLRRRSVISVLALFLLAGLIFAGLWLRSRHTQESEQLASILVDDHARYQSATTEVTSSEPEVINAWFRDRVRFSVQPPRLPDSSLVGGRLCNLQGHPAALVIYRKPQNLISLFVLDGRDIELPREHLIAVDERPCFVATERGYNVVMWKQRGLLYALVSDIRSAELLQLSAQF
jgi:anti-sigma factor RsiW